MKGFDKAGRVLEFDRITERLASLAATEGAAEALRSLQPADDGASVNRLLDQTADARAMMTVKSQPPFGRAKNITPHIERAVKGATLTTRELLDVAALLRTVGALKKYGAGGGAGRLFGSVTNTEIAEALAAQQKIVLDKRKIVLDEPIKTTGVYTVRCKLGYEISGELRVEVKEA